MIKNDNFRYADITLHGDYTASLSYMTDIPYQWLVQAIFGLKKDASITVAGLTEPGRKLFTFTDTSCHIIYECESDFPANESYSSHCIVPMGKLDFCKELYHDISSELDDWALWYNCLNKSDNGEYPYDNPHFMKSRTMYEQKLLQLKDLIDMKEKENQYDH